MYIFLHRYKIQIQFFAYVDIIGEFVEVSIYFDAEYLT